MSIKKIKKCIMVKNKQRTKKFKEGDIVLRKGKKAKIVKIHWNMIPPSVDVLMMDTNDYVNTEFNKLTKIKKKK